jgi:hypothetical protein
LNCVGIWGDIEWKDAENLIHKAGKMVLGLDTKKRVTNAAVRGDLGWSSMKGRVIQLKLRIYKKILMSSNNRLIFQVFQKEKGTFDSKNVHKSPDISWYASVAALCDHIAHSELLQISNINDFDARRKKASEINPKRMAREFDEKMWKSEMLTKSKLTAYSLIKTSLKCEQYVEVSCRSQTRTLASLRMSCHYLAIETGRWGSGDDRSNRLCHFCPTRQVEDEMHAMLHCVAYTDLREFTFQRITTASQGVCSPWLWDDEYCFHFLMSGGYFPKKTKHHYELCRIIVAYVYNTFTRRKDLFAAKKMDHAKYNKLL